MRGKDEKVTHTTWGEYLLTYQRKDDRSSDQITDDRNTHRFDSATKLECSDGTTSQ